MQALNVGDCLTSTRAVDCVACSGFLSASAGDAIRVLYVGVSPDEIDWLYCSRSDGSLGWFPRDALLDGAIVPLSSLQSAVDMYKHLPVQDDVVEPTGTEPSVSQEFVVSQDWPSDEQTGYLSLHVDDWVTIQYRCTDGDGSWAYGALRDGRAGWFPTSAIAMYPGRRPESQTNGNDAVKSSGLSVAGATCSREALEVRVHRRVQSNAGQGTHLRYKPDRTEHAPRDKAIANRRQVRHNEQVEVLKDKGEWVFVLVSNRSQDTADTVREEGWIQSVHLHPVETNGHLAVKSGMIEKDPPKTRAPSRPCPRPQEEVSSGLAPPPLKSEATLPLSLAQPAIKLVQIYTFGLQNFDPELVNLCADIDGCVRDRNIDVDILQKMFQKHGKSNIDVFKDVRVFTDRSSRDHTGVHPEILRTMARDRNFPRWLETLRSDVLAAFQASNEVRVAFYCRKGKHRSVAGARFLEHCARAEGWACSTTHLCSKHWKGTCRGQCAECSEKADSSVREEALLAAWRWWQRGC